MPITPVPAPSIGALSAPVTATPNITTSQTMPWNNPVTVAAGNVAQVDPNAMSGAVNTALDPNSPIMQRADAMANEQSNASGLLNSSMAVGSAQNAMLNQAIPIAQGNVGAQEQNVTAANAANMAELGQANQVQMSGINAQYNSVLNSNTNASTLYNNSISQVGQIQNNPNMDSATKQQAIANIMQQLQSGLSMYSGVSGVDVASGLQFSSPPAPLQTQPAPAPKQTYQTYPQYHATRARR